MKPLNRLITILFLLALFAFFLFGLNWLHLRPDERLVYDHTSNSLFYTVWYQARLDVQAPTWHSFFWVWRRIAGDTEFAGRYQGVLWSMLTASMVFLLAKSWFKAPRYGWFAMGCVSVSAYFVAYAFEVRPYPVVLLSATASMWMFWRWLQHSIRRRAIFYGVSLAVLAYIHYFLAFLVMVQAIYFIAQKPTRQQWLQYAGAGLLALLIWSPWVNAFLHQVRLLSEIDGGSIGIASTTNTTSWSAVARLARRAMNNYWYVWVGLILTGLVFVRRREYRLLLLWAFGVPAISLMVNNFANVYDERYIVYMVLGLGISVGVAIASLPYAALRWGVFVAFIALNMAAIPHRLPERIPYRNILQRINANSLPDDVLFFDEANESNALISWNIDLYLSETLQTNEVHTLEEADTARRIWYISGDPTQPDIRSRFRQLEANHPLQMVTGRCDGTCFIAQLLEGAPYNEPIARFSANGSLDVLPFYGVDVDSMNREQITVRLWWMADDPLTLDYSMSLRLTNSEGSVVAATDSPPLTEDGEQIRTSQLEPERMTIDYRVLDLPDGIVSGDYQLQMVVYQPIDGYNLTFQDKEILTLQTIIIP